MSKVRRNITVARVFQVLFYALGFPLIVHLVLNASGPLIENSLIGSGKTQLVGTISYYKGIAVTGIYIALALWLVFIVVQLLLKVFLKKKKWARVAIAVCIAAVFLVGPVMYIDFVKKPQYNEMRDAYAEEGIGIAEWGKMVVEYGGKTTDNQTEMAEFLRIYNIQKFSGKTYSSKNTDGSMSEYDAEAKAWYSPNGMYGDGYIFSYKQLSKILRDYYENKLAYEAEGKDIDLVLRQELEALESNVSSDWNKYKRGASASSFSMEDFEYITDADEYEVAYGDEGVAHKYYLTEERLNQVLSVLGRELGNNQKISDLLSVVGGLIDLGELDILALLNQNLSLDTLVDLVNEFGLGATLRQLIDPSSEETTIDSAFIFSLLASYSSYQSPMTYPVFYFIEDEGLRDYAYANYYAKIHGAKLGSVLVGTGDSPKVGLITLDASGVDAPSTQEILAKLDKFDAFEEVAKEFFPLFTLREVLVKFAALAAFCIFLSYLMTFYIDEQYKKLTVRTGVR